jgi:hypothetical protein
MDILLSWRCLNVTCTERSRCFGEDNYALGVIVRLIQWSA